VAVHSAQLFEGAPASGVAVYTVPSGVRTILKSLTVCHIGGGSTCSLQMGGVVGNKRRLWQAVMTPSIPLHIPFWIVMKTGQNLTITTDAGTPSTVTWVLSGTELTL
jgi:hypothetical protein